MWTQRCGGRTEWGNGERSREAYPSPHVKQTASGNLLDDSGNSNRGSVTAEGWDGAGDGREIPERRDVCILWLIHADIWQKPTQYCKAIILQ